jgi:CO/xanthine dehydrogenase FAD-binding subunit
MSLYLRPGTLEEALEILSHQTGNILSGGTDFFPALGDRRATGVVVDISGIRGMKGVTTTLDEIWIGGLTTWSEIITHSLPPCFDALKGAAQEVGGVQIQNRGTVAGNLCNASPAADGIPPLLALDAEVELASTAGSRKIPLSRFIVGNRKTLRRADEILTKIIVPRTFEDARSAFLKLGSRRYLVISIAMVAAVVKTDGQGNVAQAQIAVGSCSVNAQRLATLERSLIGAPAKAGLGTMVSPEHLSTLAPIDDVRGTAGYRSDAVLTLVSRALEICGVNCCHGNHE